MTVQAQVHSKFEIFLSSPGAAPLDAIQDLAAQVKDWSKNHPVDPKSLGVEYIEHTKTLVLTIGYAAAADPKDSYSVRISSISLGVQFPGGKEPYKRVIAQEMEQAAQKVRNVICHEFFVTETGEMILCLMST